MEMETRKERKNVISYIVIFFVGCLVMYGIVYFFPTSITKQVTKLEKDVTVTETGIADAVEKVYDSVVVVTTYSNDKAVASGTGFVYKKDGNTYYILTNHHVIADGNKVTVTFTDGSVVETTIVGSDEYSDIAVLSLKSKEDLAVADIGKSEDSRVGDTAFAVGAPLNSAYSWSVTRGIISGKDRMVAVAIGNSQTSNYVMKVMQTDTAINSGNSGGPLCNSNGEVIGITSLKLASTGIEGMGFALPIEDAISKAEQIISGEETEYPYLGVSMLDFSQAYYSYEYYDLIRSSNLTGGVIVASVEKGSAAATAGLQAKDIITEIDGKEVTSVAYFRYYLFQHKVGDEITIKVIRNGEEVTLKAKLTANKQMA